MFSRSLFIFLVLISSACSVYRSTGRESFENKAPASVGATSISATENETCWTQPSTDPLWNFDSNQGLGEKFSNELSVIRLNEREIEVCAKPVE